jgi:hypothetical protein
VGYDRAQERCLTEPPSEDPSQTAPAGPPVDEASSTAGASEASGSVARAGGEPAARDSFEELLADRPIIRALWTHERALGTSDVPAATDPLFRWTRALTDGPDERVLEPHGELTVEQRAILRLERARRRLDGDGERWCDHEPGLVEAVGGGLGALFVHLRVTVLYGLAILLSAGGLLGVLAYGGRYGRLVQVGAAIAAYLLWTALFRLVAGSARAALDAARGRRSDVRLASEPVAEMTWILWGLTVLAPRELGRVAEALVPAPALFVASALGLAVFATLLVVAVDRGHDPLGAMASVTTGAHGRRGRLAGVVGLALLAVSAAALARYVRLDSPARGAFVPALALVGAPILVGTSVAQVVAGWSDVEARAAARGRRRRTLREGAELSWRTYTANVATFCLAAPALVEAWTARRVDLRGLAPWLLSVAGSYRLTFVLVPLVVAVALLALERRRRLRIDADDDGLLLDVTPSWPGRRIPWSAVSVRPYADGLRLVLAGRPAFLGPWIPRGEDFDLDELVDWLEARGARLDG